MKTQTEMRFISFCVIAKKKKKLNLFPGHKSCIQQWRKRYHFTGDMVTDA